ncbi:MAG: hypothetical protein QXP88_00225 [Thermoproteota archaeon]
MANSNTNYYYTFVGYSFKIKNINNVQNFLLKVDNYLTLSFFQHQNQNQNTNYLQTFPGLFYIDDYVQLNFFQYQNQNQTQPEYCLQNYPNPFYYVKSNYPNYTIELIDSNGIYSEKYCPQIDISQINDLQLITDDIFPVNSSIHLHIEYKNPVSTFDLFEVGFYSQAHTSNKIEITR